MNIIYIILYTIKPTDLSRILTLYLQNLFIRYAGKYRVTNVEFIWPVAEPVSTKCNRTAPTP